MKSMQHIPIRYTAATLAFLLGTLAGCSTLGPSGLQNASRPDESTTEEPAIAEEEVIPPPQEKPKPGQLYDWQGDGRRVSRVIIDVDEQRARFYDGNEQIGWTTVATGVKTFPTPTGQFEVIEKVTDKRSNIYGKIYNKGGQVIKSNARIGRDEVPEGGRFAGAKMPYFMRLTYDGVGLHAGSIPRPGQPASHGCIRLPRKLAPILFTHVDYGTPVRIIGSGPSYGDYVEKIRVAARQRAAAERAAAEEAARTPPVTLASGQAESAPEPTVPTSDAERPSTPSDEGLPSEARATASQAPTTVREPAAADVAVEPTAPAPSDEEPIPAPTDEPAAIDTAPTNPTTEPEPDAPISPVPLTAIPVTPDATERYGP
ncbi:hypothetical protein Thimo_0626 [Thioflavicoccus mobilis 8321]|uniref:L,D-TPase catalytic domain-containing protein n=1 Tax=Thioflavicoccus mobilis 8321 TaxID=765912 RepID=L0GUI8_9GAMM|nr:L,D-transpeptidase family protein [Thioflavicoccus mobilis]AGA89467.1 hypothetical protein Thimo_0626 [Thioflavicoccus mobilis 8321]